MKAKLINDVGEKTYAIVFDKGDEVVEGCKMDKETGLALITFEPD